MPHRFRSAALSFAALTLAAGPVAAQQRAPVQMPPKGMALADADRAELTAGLAALDKDIEAFRAQALLTKSNLLDRLPDVQIYENAVRYPLTYNEIYDAKDVASARHMLDQGEIRIKALAAGSAPWTTQTGLIVLGYVSRIDGSVQPYGLQVPTTYLPSGKRPHRLDFFLHGRDEKLTELHFVDQRERQAGEFSPADAFVLQPYGRYCNANRFAGEVDLFEALNDAKKRYPIDPDRIVMRGFSMGGASCWQFGTHHADEFAACAPGAGFTETAVFLGAFGPGRPPIPDYQQTLWHWYDSVDYAVNLSQVPTIAYSGEIDGQRKAADNMAAAIAKEGMPPLTQVIGPNTGHRYAPESKPIINQFVDAAVAKGREKMPLQIRFTTFTLRYNHMDWLTVDGMDQHWKRARVEASRTAAGDVTLTTENVSALTLTLPRAAAAHVTIDGQKLSSGNLSFAKSATGKWSAFRPERNATFHKLHGLQGPIDDAFMDRFVMVRPTGTPANPAVGAWEQAEMAHAIGFWRAEFRGDAPVVDDKALTAEQIAGANLILWGDPSSNAVIAKIAAKLPIQWDRDGTVHAHGKTYPAGTTVPILIYPNPLNPAHYVVLNSGITFRESALTNNAMQTAKLPDWAIVDISTPPDERTPGLIADAGFFDEAWQLKP